MLVDLVLVMAEVVRLVAMVVLVALEMEADA